MKDPVFSEPPRYLAVTRSVSASPEEYKRIGKSGRRLHIFLQPLLSGSHLFSVCLTCGTGNLVLLVDGVTDLFPYTAQCLVLCGTCFAAVTEAILTNFSRFRMRSGPQILRSILASTCSPFTAVTFGACSLEEYRFIGFSRETTAGFLRIQLPRLFTVIFVVEIREAVFEVDSCPALQRHTWNPGVSMSPCCSVLASLEELDGVSGR